jgi:hypothetical protein
MCRDGTDFFSCQCYTPKKVKLSKRLVSIIPWKGLIIFVSFSILEDNVVNNIKVLTMMFYEKHDYYSGKYHLGCFQNTTFQKLDLQVWKSGDKRFQLSWAPLNELVLIIEPFLSPFFKPEDRYRSSFWNDVIGNNQDDGQCP